MTTINWVALFSGSIGITQIFFGVYIYLKNKEKPLSWIFLISAVSIALWLIPMAAILSGYIESRGVILVLDRITFASAPIIMVSIILYLKGIMPNGLERIWSSPIYILILFLGLTVFILSPTNLISANPGEQYIVAGQMMWLLVVFMTISAVYIIYLGMKGYYTSDNSVKHGFLFTGLGIGISAIGVLIFNLLLPALGYTAYPQLAAASSVFMIILMGAGVAGSYILGIIGAFVVSFAALTAFVGTILFTSLKLFGIV